MRHPLLLIAIVMLCGTASTEAQEKYHSGQHYQEVKPAVESTVPAGSIEVVELFWYGCPHCYQFEPQIEKWLEEKPEKIAFKRVPAIFAKNWEVHARAFYAAEQLGILERSHRALFDAIHEDHRKLFTEDQLAEFYAGFGVSEDAFRKAYNSFDVDAKTRQAMALTRRYGINGVPAIVVDGRYRSSTQQTGSYEELLNVTDFLAAKSAADARD